MGQMGGGDNFSEREFRDLSFSSSNSSCSSSSSSNVGRSSPLERAASAHISPSSLPTDFPLYSSFLVGVPTEFINPILAFNHAVWSFRKPALAARSEQTTQWLANRILELANINLRSCKPKAKERKQADIDQFINDHYAVIDRAPESTVYWFTDGSSIPNPGPCGSGVFILAPDLNIQICAGAPCGLGTNNVGELIALCICIQELINLFHLKQFKNAFIFSDSSYSISAASSSRRPWSNLGAIILLRELLRRATPLFAVNLHWVKAHASIPGNEVADQIAKKFSFLSKVEDAPRYYEFPYFHSQQHWPFGAPLSNLPPHLFVPLPFPLISNRVICSDTNSSYSSKAIIKEKPIQRSLSKYVSARSSLRLANKGNLASDFTPSDSVSESLAEPLDYKHMD